MEHDSIESFVIRALRSDLLLACMAGVAAAWAAVFVWVLLS